MKRSQFIFDNKKSFEDFDLITVSVTVGMPSINRITDKVPYMHGHYDFSSLYGEKTYSNREVKIKVAPRIRTTRTKLNIIYDNVIKWLFDADTSELQIDYIEGCFLAAIKDISKKEKFLNTESIEITFDCYPFRLGKFYEGHDIWDEFAFDLDYAQPVKFDVRGFLEISLHNVSSTSVTPTVVCFGDIEVSNAESIYSFTSGETKDYRFKLKKGDNHLKLKGNGTIEFKFRKEVL